MADQELIAAGAAVAVVAMAVRLVPGTLWKRTGSDAGYHLLVRREIRRNGFRMPRKIDALLLDERQTYPWLYHLAIAVVPQRALVRYPALPSALIDAGLAMLAFVAAAMLAGGVTGAHQVAAALLAGGLTALSPALLGMGIGPRSYEVTPRPLGELLFTGAMLAAGWTVTGTAGSVAFAVAVLLFGLAVRASKFAVQVVTFCTPVVGALTGSWGLALVSLPALAVTLATSGGRHWVVLTGQLRHLGLYRSRLQYEHPAVRQRTHAREVVVAVIGSLRARLRDRALNRQAAELVDSHPLVSLVMRNVALVALLVGVLAWGEPVWIGPADHWRRFLWAWTLAPLVPFCLTALPGWRFLGEAERYLEYSIVPGSVLLALAWWSWPAGARAATGALLVAAIMVTILYVMLRRRLSGLAEPDHAVSAVAGFLTTLPTHARLLPIPMTLAFLLAWQGEARFLAAMDHFVWASRYEQLFVRYPWLHTDIEQWISHHGATHAVVSKAALHADPRGPLEYGLEMHDLLYENMAFAVYALRPAAGGRQNQPSPSG